jgi:hypothetical protein
MAGFLKANQAGALGLSPGDKDLVTIQTPDGAKFQVARKVAPQFNAFLTDLHGTGYKLNPKVSGGYNYRTIAGTPKLSQHAYGNAIDLNWDKNPYGSKRSDLPANIGEIAAKHGIAWGGTWKNPDPMHFEVSTLTPGAPAANYVAANAANEVANNGAPKTMASPIGGAPVAGGPVPLELVPPSQRHSKLADALLASAAGAKPKNWGELLNAGGDLALGYVLGDKADKQQQAYQGKLAQALMGASGDTNNLATTLIGSGNPELVQQGVALKVSQAKESAPLRGREAFLPLPNGDVLDLNRMAPVPGITPKQEMTSDMREYAFSMKQRKDAGQPLVSFDDWAKTLKPNLAANKPVEVGGRLVQMNPATNQYEEVYVPPQKPAQLQAGDRKEIFEADEGAQASRNVIGSLDKALGMNDKAYSGFGAQTRGYLGSLVGSESGAATEELQNVVTQQVLENLKSTFGSAPTEGERQILLDVQGSVSKSPEVRRRIFENAKAAAQRRLGFNTERAGALRSGDYFKPGYSPSAPEVAAPAPAAQPEAAAAPKQIRSQEEFSALPSGARFIDPEGKVRIKP